MPNVFEVAAERLHLTLQPPGAGLFTLFEIAGSVDGHVVRVRRDPMMRQLRTEVFLQSALDLGLHVVPAGQINYGTSPPAVRGLVRLVGRVLGKTDLHVGDRAVDDAFDIHGDEQARVASLLEPTRAALLQWAASSVSFEIDDAHVGLRRYSSLTSGETADDVCGDVVAALDLVRKLESARASLPPATALAPHVASFRAFAGQHGMPLTTTPLATWGPLRSADFWAHATRVAPGSFASCQDNLGTAQTSGSAAASRFELEMGLRWQDASRTLPGLARTATPKDGARTTPTGDAAFDAAFVVTGALATRLPAEARQELLELAKAGGDVSLGDAGLHLRVPLGAEPCAIEALADRASTALHAAAAALEARTAYR